MTHTGSGYEDYDAAAMRYHERLIGTIGPARELLRDDFTRECLPFAGRLAHRYRGRGEPADDLEQVARLAMLKAIDGFDPQRGSFTAYAVVTVSGELKRHFRDRTWGMHVTRRMQDLGLAVRHARAAMTADLARTPTTSEIAENLHEPAAEVAEAIAATTGYSPASLNAPAAGADGAELGDLLGALDDDLEMVDNRVTMAVLLRHLSPREQRMLALRFHGNRSQVEIADELGISQMHVSRLLRATLARLREALMTDLRPRRDEPRLRVRADRTTGPVVVTVAGEIDRDNAEQLRTALHRTVSHDDVVVDLAGVALVDAAGVAVLHDAARVAAVGGHDLTLAHARPWVVRVLTATGLSRLLSDD
nr:sigma-70 family RNA polymerase sigma factor [uncultured Actinoplanes sp.]